ncbi:hypothetical protein Tco_0729963 [Tanacetum coccineum]|uniref:Uncharacterized protein n=1 Tax=Tanacetum coccineum TaxID=301880 RepID=A0ABQ4YT59_9ASTR
MSTSTSTSSSMKLHHSFRICLQYECWFGGKLIMKLRQKEVDEESLLKTCRYITLGGRGGESFWEGGDDFGVDVLRFHTCLTDILGFLEKLEWWFEQDIDKEEERFEGDEDGGEV